MLGLAAAVIVLVGVSAYLFRTASTPNPRTPPPPGGSSVSSTVSTGTNTPTVKPAPKPFAKIACSEDVRNRIGMNLKPSLIGDFQGMTIRAIANQTLSETKSKATPFTAITSSDNARLLIAFLSCDGTEMLPVMHMVSYTSSTDGALLLSLPEYYGSNFGALFHPIGFIGTTHRALLEGGKIDLGAGGSCAPISWKSLDVDTKRVIDVTTDPEHLVYNRYGKVVFFSPNPCVNPPKTIRIADMTTGKIQTIKNLSGSEYGSLESVTEEQRNGKSIFTLHYKLNEKELTLVLP